MKKQEFKNNIDNVVNLMITTLACFNLIIGFDLKTKKLVLKDIDSDLISRLDLTELNKIILSEISKGDVK